LVVSLVAAMWERIMNEHATARHYGRLLGLLSGLFALLQVLISVSSVKSNALTVAGLQSAVNSTVNGTPTDPLNLLGDLVPVLVITYLSAAVAGAIMMGFAWYAGRLTALTIGRREFGGIAGFWTALWFGGAWLALAAGATSVAHADGTISGLFFSTPGPSQLGTELILLLLQNGFAALCGLGLGALAGFIGARGAPISRFTAFRPPLPPTYAPGYASGYASGYTPGYPYPAPPGPAAGWPSGYPPQQWRPPSGGPPAQGAARDTQNPSPHEPVTLG
jgi:hypothetical protein